MRLQSTGSLQLLNNMIDIYLMADNALSFTHVLANIQAEHMSLFCRLYPDSVKNKPHYVMHIPGQMAKRNVNLSTWAPERKHKSVIAAGNYSSGKHFERYIVRKMVVNHIAKAANDPNLTKTNHVEEYLKSHRPEHVCQQAVAFQMGYPRIRVGHTLHTSRSTYKAGDVVCCSLGNTVLDYVGKIQHIFVGEEPGGSDVPFVVLSLLEPRHGRNSHMWRFSAQDLCAVHAQYIKCAVMYAQFDDDIRLLIPKYM